MAIVSSTACLCQVDRDGKTRPSTSGKTEQPAAREGANLKDIINGSLGIFQQQRREVFGEERAAALGVDLIALRVEHLVVLPQLPPNVWKIDDTNALDTSVTCELPSVVLFLACMLGMTPADRHYALHPTLSILNEWEDEESFWDAPVYHALLFPDSR